MNRSIQVTRYFYGAIGLVGLAFLGYFTVLRPPSFDLFWIGILTTGLVAFLANYPLSLVFHEVTFVQTITLGTGLLFGLPFASWTSTGGLLIGHSIRYLRSTREGTRWPIRSATVLKTAFAIGSQLIPLTIVLNLSYWLPSNDLVLRDLSFDRILILSLAFAIIHGLISLIDLLTVSRTADPTLPRAIISLVLIELLPLPFVLLAVVTASDSPISALIALGGIPMVLAILLQETSSIRQDLERRLLDLSTLNKVSQTLRSSLDMESLLTAIQRQVTQLLGVDNFYVALYDFSDQQLWYPLAVKNGQRQEWPRRPLMERLTDRVIRERRPLLLAQDAGRELAKIGLPPSEDAPYAWLGVPLITPERTLGCLAVFAISPDISFTPEDQNLLTTLSGQVSVAIENALLYEQAQRRATQLENLNRISTLISASLDPQEVLEQICRSVSQVGGGQRSAVFLTDTDLGEIRLAYAHGLSEAFARSQAAFPMAQDGWRHGLRSGRPTLTSDIDTLTTQSEFLEILKQENIRAFGDFPLVTPEGQIGYLSVYYSHPHVFNPEEVDLLQTFASQAALAVSNARLYAQTDMALTRRAHQLAILESIGRELAAAIHSDQLFKLILDYALDFTNSPWGSLNLYDATTRTIAIKASRGYTLSRTHYQDTDGIAGRVIQTRQAENIGDVTKADQYLDLTGGAARSQLSVPLIHEDKVLGVLTVESPIRNAFTQNDQSFISQLATQAAIAVINAQLYRETRRRLRDQARLYEVSKKLVGNQKLNSVLESIVSSIGELLDGLATGIYLWDERERTYLLQAVADQESDYREHLPERIDEAQIRKSKPAHIGTEMFILPQGQVEASAIVGPCRRCPTLLLPLRIRELPIGIVLSHLPADTFLQEADLQLPRSIAAQGAIAIQNALLFSDVTSGRDRLEAVLNSVEEGVLMVNADGVVILANASIQSISGVLLNDILNQPLSQLPQPMLQTLGLTPRQAENLLENLGADRRLPPSKIALRDKNYQLKHVFERFTAPVWGEGRNIIGLVFVLRDVSEQYRLDQAKELITETLVHDLRSPMGTVSSALSLLDDSFSENDHDPVARQSLNIAQRSANRVLGLIESLLDISRMETGSIQLALSTFSLYNLVNEILVEFISQAHDLGIVLHSEINESTPHVHADQEKIGRVLANLLDNALKFTPEGGQITISIEELKSQIIAVRIRDTGPGIPVEYREKIFDRFSQVPGQLSRRRGSGIGLTFCRLAVEAHGGKIWVEPPPEGGSIFIFTLPIANPQTV